jgi:subtilase family serine protease
MPVGEAVQGTLPPAREALRAIPVRPARAGAGRTRPVLCLCVAALLLLGPAVVSGPGPGTPSESSHSLLGPSSGGVSNTSLTNAPVPEVAPGVAGTLGPSDPATAERPDPSAYDPNGTVSVTLLLASRGNLSALAGTLEDPASPTYRDFLSPALVEEAYGLAPARQAQLERYFASFGLAVIPDTAGLILTLQGTGAQMAAAFHTRLSTFQITSLAEPPAFSPRVVTGALAPPRVPSSLRADLAGVLGLDGEMGNQAFPDLARYPGLPTLPRGAGLPAAAPGTSTISLSQALNETGGNFTWFDASATSVCADYAICGDQQMLYPATMPALEGATALWRGNGTAGGLADEGQGITAAVIEVGCAPLTDLTGFSQQVFGSPSQVPDRVTQIGVGISDVNSCLNDGYSVGWTAETDLDVEYLAAMAPRLHIDVLAVPNAQFSSFDTAYAFLGDHLVSPTCTVPGTDLVLNGSGSMCGVSLDSNSYGSSEELVAYQGAPMYLTAEDQLLSYLNVLGVTNVFASGDAGTQGTASSAGVPAISPGSTSVGGGQMTAAGPGGRAFPATGVNTTLSSPSLPPLTVTVARAQGVAGFTYWSASDPGTIPGSQGGGFGSSISEGQPWWQNGLDTFSTGTALDPVVSGSAGFNMTLYDGGAWYPFYGGTSFAAPVLTGILALLAEQLQARSGAAGFGNVDPLLYSVHNALEALAPAPTGTFVPMLPEGSGPDWGPGNLLSGYLRNMSVNVPPSPILPSWYNLLANPAGGAWSFLGGLGSPSASGLLRVLFGNVFGRTSGLLDSGLTVSVRTDSGWGPLTSLPGDVPSELRVTDPLGDPVAFSGQVEAYSGGSDQGTYGGGTRNPLSPGPSGTFNYTPAYAPGPTAGNASEYGYFTLNGTGGTWGFVPFAIVPPPPGSGILKLCLFDALGLCSPGTAEVTMVSPTSPGALAPGALGLVTLNGLPAPGAVVVETAVNVSAFAGLDPTLAPGTYAPGTVIGRFLADGGGLAVAWTDAYATTLAGTVPAQMALLQAFDAGLASSPVLLFAEPWGGSFLPDLGVNAAGTRLIGNLSFSSMHTLDYLNVSVGAGPGEFTNVTFSSPCGTPGCFPRGNVSSGTLALDLALPGPADATVNVSFLAVGQDSVESTVSVSSGILETVGNQTPVIWAYRMTLLPGTTPLAATLTPVPVSGTAPLTVRFNATVTGGEGALSYRWSFGDGNTSSLLAPSHLFDRPGHYTVTLAVEDALGDRTTSSVTVDVSSPPGPAPFLPPDLLLPTGLVLGALMGLAAGVLLGRRGRATGSRDGTEPRPREPMSP